MAKSAGASYLNILTMLSQPPVAILLVFACSGWCEIGAHDTELTPVECASIVWVSHVLLYVKIDTFPSEDAHASSRPCSCGEKAIELTDAACSRCWYSLVQVPSWSFQIITLAS